MSKILKANRFLYDSIGPNFITMKENIFLIIVQITNINLYFTKGKIEPHTAGFNMGYFYSYTNGGAVVSICAISRITKLRKI